MYKAIGFDFGGVLNHGRPIMPGFSEITGIPKDELREYYLRHNHLANVGSMSYEELWTKVVSDLGHADKAERIIEHMHQQHSEEYDDRMLKLIDELRYKGYKTGLLSNNSKQNAEILRKKGLEKHFDVFLISAEIGVQKPDPDAFIMLSKGLGVEPQEMIFVDDSESSLRLADKIGYHPILFSNYEDFRTELVDLNILI